MMIIVIDNIIMINTYIIVAMMRFTLQLGVNSELAWCGVVMVPLHMWYLLQSGLVAVMMYQFGLTPPSIPPSTGRRDQRLDQTGLMLF